MSIQQLLELAIERKASDIHLLIGSPPMLRVWGDLVPVTGAPILVEADIQGLILPILTPVQKQVFEASSELDFGFTFPGKARFRVNVYKQQGTIAAALRHLALTIPTLESLGLPPVVERLVTLRQGLILVTGPTGQGKSTTLAALLNKINLSRSTHILTIEDPIEYIYPRAKSIVSQREMFLDTRTWPNALRAALREDPDVVLVGEMRDYETIAATITVAETGHLVFATLHTNSASQSIDRIIDVFPQNQQPQVRLQMAEVMEAVISQRLVPTITPGRTLAAEILLKTPALGSMIREGKSFMIDNLIQTSAELGMVSLESSLAALVRAGKISYEVAQAYALRPELFARLTGLK